MRVRANERRPGVDQGTAESPGMYLSGRWLFAARAGWLFLAALSVALFVFSLPLEYAQIRSLSGAYSSGAEITRANLSDAGLSTGSYAAYWIVVEVAFAAGCLAVATVIYGRRSDDRMALLVALLLVLLGTTFWETFKPLGEQYPALWWLGKGLANLGNLLWVLFFFIFPNGWFVPRWTRWLSVVLVVWALYIVFFPGSALDWASWSEMVLGLVLLGFVLTGTASQVYRYRRVSGPVERQQSKWVTFGFAAGLLGFLTVLLLEGYFPAAFQDGTPGQLLGLAAIDLSLFAIPLSVGVAVLRYRLFDIDVIINRTLVYGALTASIVGLYALIVAGLGTLLHSRGGFLISLLAAGLVAVAFQPLRSCLQRGVNRMMYGEGDDPYSVLSRLGQRLEVALAPDTVLAAIVETVAQALKLPYAAIAVERGEGSVTVAEYGTPQDESVDLPLVYQSERMGRLILAPRAPGETFSSADWLLLRDLARQAGGALRAARLTADLQRSRERLVAAREEERRRLRRDLHDGLGPQLAAQTLKIGSARSLYDRDPAAADVLLSQLETDMETALADIRRLVYNLRPPTLDELGLIGAILETAGRYNSSSVNGNETPRITVEAPEKLSNLPAAVEVAVYRISQEALTNVVRHARANACTVRLSIDGEVELEVSDDGVGLGDDRGAGVGLSSMRERALELGGTLVVEPSATGGTRVRARLPLPDGRTEFKRVSGDEDESLRSGRQPTAAPEGR